MAQQPGPPGGPQPGQKVIHLGADGQSVAEQLKFIKSEFYAVSGEVNSKFDEIFKNLVGVIAQQQFQLNQSNEMLKSKDEHIAQLSAQLEELKLLSQVPGAVIPKPAETPKKEKKLGKIVEKASQS